MLASAVERSRRAAGGGPPIDHDLTCPGCGYNLIGLARDAACPECGATKRHGVSLQVASCDAIEIPPAGLRLMAIGARLMAGPALLLPLCFAWADAEPYSWAKVLAHGVTLAVGLVWIAGVIILTIMPRLEDRDVALQPPPWWANLRLLSRAGAVFPALAAAMGLWLSLDVRLAGTVVEWSIPVLRALSAAGLIPVCCLATMLAEGGRDDDQAARLRVCLWLLPPLLILHSLGVWFGPLAFWIRGGFVVGVVLGGGVLIVMLALGLGALGSTLAWAARHAEADEERSARRARREEARIRRATPGGGAGR